MKSEVKLLSRVQLFATPWTVAYQASLSMGFSRQNYWSGLPFPSPGDLPDPGIEPGLPALEADALTSEPPGKLFHYKREYIGVSKHIVILSLTVWFVILLLGAIAKHFSFTRELTHPWTILSPMALPPLLPLPSLVYNCSLTKGFTFPTTLRLFWLYWVYFWPLHSTNIWALFLCQSLPDSYNKCLLLVLKYLVSRNAKCS